MLESLAKRNTVLAGVIMNSLTAFTKCLFFIESVWFDTPSVAIWFSDRATVQMKEMFFQRSTQNCKKYFPFLEPGKQNKNFSLR